MQTDQDLIWESYMGPNYKDIILDYVDEFRFHQRLPSAVNAFASNPKYQYSDVAYRAVYLPLDQAGLPLDKIHQIIKSNPTHQTVTAWSKSLGGLKVALNHLSHDGHMQHNLGVILCCESIRAVDINKLFPERWEGMKNEHEILTTEWSNFTIVGYVHTFAILGKGDLSSRPEYLEYLQEYIDDEATY